MTFSCDFYDTFKVNYLSNFNSIFVVNIINDFKLEISLVFKMLVIHCYVATFSSKNIK
jgi:hypothetical protein